MKRRKVLALILVVAVMLMGVGYAAWTDSFKTETTINTGELEILLKECADSEVQVYEKAKGSENAWKNPNGNYNIAYADPNINQKEKKATFQFENLFPGTKSVAKFKAKNIGTVPAVIQDVKVTVKTKADVDDNHHLEKAIFVNYYFVIKEGGRSVKFIDGECELLKLEDALNNKIHGINGIKGITLEPDSELTTKNDSQKIEDKFTFFIKSDSLKNDQGEEEIVEITIDFNFIQSNLYNSQK